MRISDWSSDVCSSDLAVSPARVGKVPVAIALAQIVTVAHVAPDRAQHVNGNVEALGRAGRARCEKHQERRIRRQQDGSRVLKSEEHTSELQSLMRISYAVFCLKKKKQNKRQRRHTDK